MEAGTIRVADAAAKLVFSSEWVHVAK
jgi:hypothetical protein